MSVFVAPFRRFPLHARLTRLGIRLCLVLACCQFPRQTAAQNCIDYTSNLRLLSGIPTPNYARGLAREGDRIYVAASGTYEQGLYIVDAADPSNMTVLGGVGGFQAFTVGVSGDVAYVASGNTMKVFDVSNPEAPVEKVTLALPDGAESIATSGNYAYAVVPCCGVQVLWDGPVNPLSLGTLFVPGTAQAITRQDDVAYVVGSAGLTTVDLSAPASPRILQTLSLPGTGEDVCVDGDHAYVADGDALRIVDVVDPANPVLLGTLVTGEPANLVGVVGNTVLVGDADLLVVDVTDPTQPVASIPFIVSDRSNGVTDVLLVPGGGVGFLATWELGLQAIDTSTMSVAVPLGQETGTPVDVAASGDHAFTASDEAGLEVFDVSDPTLPQRIASFDTPGNAQGITLVGTTAYLADMSGGLRAFDVATPTTPTELGSVQPPAGPAEVVVLGNHAYTIPWFYVLDVTSPQAMHVVNSLPLQLARGIALNGSTAYVADAFDGLVVIDLQDPVNPFITWKMSTPCTPLDIDVFGDRGYLQCEEGLHILDVSNPAVPNFIGEIVTPFGYPISVAPDGDLLYLGLPDTGMLVYDVGDPMAPVLLGGTTPPFHGRGLAVHDGMLLAAGSYNGFFTLGLQCELQPTDVASGPTPSGALTMWPNPLRGGSQVQFVTPQASRVRLEVFDVLGRRVRTILSTSLPAGTYRRHWDGTDAHGSPVAQGVYFLRLSHDEDVVTRRITVLR